MGADEVLEDVTLEEVTLEEVTFDEVTFDEVTFDEVADDVFDEDSLDEAAKDVSEDVISEEASPDKAASLDAAEESAISELPDRVPPIEDLLEVEAPLSVSAVHEQTDIKTGIATEMQRMRRNKDFFIISRSFLLRYYITNKYCLSTRWV